MIRLIFLVTLIFVSCDSGNEAFTGCLDQTACNFNENATVDNGSCVYPEANFDCEGNCDVDIDCNNECGGTAELDECGICAGYGIPEGGCDCDGNVYDCNGDCGGSALLDYCGICMGSCIEGLSDSCDELDCFGECYGDASVDDCGICGGNSSSCTDEDIFYLGSFTDNGLEILYNSSYDIAGFQFGISGVDLITASGGSAEEYGFTVTVGNILLGFSFEGNVIPVGEGILTNLEINIQNDVSELCITDLFVTNIDGQLPFQIGDCLPIPR